RHDNRQNAAANRYLDGDDGTLQKARYEFAKSGKACDGQTRSKEDDRADRERSQLHSILPPTHRYGCLRIPAATLVFSRFTRLRSRVPPSWPWADNPRRSQREKPVRYVLVFR